MQTQRKIDASELSPKALETLRDASNSDEPVLLEGADGSVFGVVFGARSIQEVSELVRVRQQARARQEFASARRRLQEGFADASEEVILEETQKAIAEVREEQAPDTGQR